MANCNSYSEQIKTFLDFSKIRSKKSEHSKPKNMANFLDVLP